VAIALDSDVVVGFLDSDDARHRAADSAIRELVREQPLVVSAVTYAEVLTGARLGHHDEEKVAGFFTKLVSRVLSGDAKAAKVKGLDCQVRLLS
jgi:predicted nucleic acid-binding protein